MGFRDLLLFYLVTGFSVRWVSNAAAAGPSAVAVWLIGCVALYVPLVFTVLELSSRYPEEGGCYVWVKRAFGEFPGFLTAWTYWACNLPYFPSLFYFTAASALFIGGPGWQGLAGSPAYFIGFSLVGLAIAAGLNVRGLAVGKWLHNLGAVGLWVPTLLLLLLGFLAWRRFGSATPFTAQTLRPGARIQDLIFWSTIAFSLSGLESASMMGEEIESPRRNLPRALLLSGVLITLLYILGTVAILVALPQAEVKNLDGFMRSVAAAAGRLDLGWVTVAVAILVTLGGLGQAGAWFAAAARLPFVAGIDRLLPAALGPQHPR
jgi:amino acid transporter